MPFDVGSAIQLLFLCETSVSDITAGVLRAGANKDRDDVGDVLDVAYARCN